MIGIVTIDFETYYDREYSLSKMTTEAYIRDPRFEIIGVGVKVNNEATTWHPGGSFKTLHLDFSNRAILCHNTAFDGAILSWRFGIRPRFWLDTLSMARPFHNMTVGGSLANLATHYGLGRKGNEVVNALGKRRTDFTETDLAQYGRYCINDVDLTWRLFNKLKVGFPVRELLVIDQTLRMYTEPMIELDAPLLEKHLEEVRTRKQALMADLDQEVLLSNEKFADYLTTLGVTPPTKISARTNKTAWALAKTDSGMTDLLEHPDERVRTAVSARLGVKSTLEETRTETLIDVAARGRLPIMLNYYGAHTGRFSGGDKINLQNLPSRGNTTIKRALKALPGHVLVAADSSQIEARMVAYVAGQDDLVTAFRGKRDVYSEFATEIYGRSITKADRVERFVGKTCIAEGTLVLSSQGWKPIEQVTTRDLLWDGEVWVDHQGLLNNGIKPTLNLCGAWLTPDHQVWSGTQWLEARSVVADENTLHQVLQAGAKYLPPHAGESNPYRAVQTFKCVYDILNCGPRNKFTILTAAGPVIVHNCILGLGYGMGAAKLQRTLEIGQNGLSVKIDLNEAERIVRIYRNKNFKIVQFWQKCGNMLQGGSGHLHDVLPYDSTGITMPSGFKIQYPALRNVEGQFEYINNARTYQKLLSDECEGLVWTRIYGGKVTENIIQALAAIVIREQMVSIGQHYHVVLQVHDEIIITVPEEDASEAQVRLVEIMSTPPKWAPDLCVACESGVGVNYGDT